MHTLKRIIWRYQSTTITARPKDVFIASAVRTPIGRFRKTLAPLTATQLGALAIETAFKRAALPHDSIEEVYMGMECTAGVGQAPARQAALGAGLPKSVCTTTVIAPVAVAGAKAIMLAAHALALGHTQIAVAGGMNSASNVPYYLARGAAMSYGHRLLADGLVEFTAGREHISKCLQATAQKFSISDQAQEEYANDAYACAASACAAGVFDAEIAKVRITQKSRREIVIAEDAIMKPDEQLIGSDDYAAALVLCTSDTVQRFDLKPLARIVDFLNVETTAIDLAHTTCLVVSRLLERQGIDAQEIDRWEINVMHPIMPLAFMRQLQINRTKVNMHGGWASEDGACCSGLVTHLAHSLRPRQMGCAVSYNTSNGIAAAILIEKCANSTAAAAPAVLTLYTKDPCPLCDILVEELQTHFAGEYELEKVFITQKENVRFLRLFRYDIPVLFLNGQFLCMHKLNMKLLRHRLSELKC